MEDDKIRNRLLDIFKQNIDAYEQKKPRPALAKVDYIGEGVVGGKGTKAGAAKNKWIKWVKFVRKNNPELSYKDALKSAKQTYRENTQEGSGRVGGMFNYADMQDAYMNKMFAKGKIGGKGTKAGAAKNQWIQYLKDSKKAYKDELKGMGLIGGKGTKAGAAKNKWIQYLKDSKKMYKDELKGKGKVGGCCYKDMCKYIKDKEEDMFEDMMMGEGIIGGKGTKAGAAKNKWIKHVKDVYLDNFPFLTYKEALKEAKITYNKEGMGKVGGKRISNLLDLINAKNIRFNKDILKAI